MADSGQGVVLGADHDGEGTGTGPGLEGGGQIVGAGLHGEAPGGQGLGHPLRGVGLFETELRSVVDLPGEGDQFVLGRLDHLPSRTLHCRLFHFGHLCSIIR